MKKQYSLTVLLALVASLVGGIASTHFLMGQPVFAEKKEQPKKVIIAQEFRLVDKDGNITGQLFNDKSIFNMPTLRLGQDGSVAKLSSILGLVCSDSDSQSNYAQNGMIVMSKSKKENEPHEIVFQQQMAFIMVSGYPQIHLSDKNGKQFIRLALSDALISQPLVEDNKPSIVVGNPDGFHSIIGSCDLVGRETGSKVTRSSASIVMVDKEGKVIWKAP